MCAGAARQETDVMEHASIARPWIDRVAQDRVTQDRVTKHRVAQERPRAPHGVRAAWRASR
ncbi:hypothetical protein WL93_14020 [Burkholderia diffusa]|nr:hypothetical protein WL93_14020 [Burkholderia diffusa]